MKQRPAQSVRPQLAGGGDCLSPVRHRLGLLIAGIELLLDGSRLAVDWLVRQRRWHLAGARLRRSMVTGTDPILAVLGTRTYAPATRRRYAQVAWRFSAWLATEGRSVAGPGVVTRFLTEAVGVPTGDLHDPAHRGLGRTTLCALRATLEPLGAEGLTAGLRLPPHPPRRPVPEPAVVTRLWEAARSVRERLMLVLCCGLALRPGQMAGLRWGDVDRRRRVVRFTAYGQGRQVDLPEGCYRILRRHSRGMAPGDFVFPPLAGRRAQGPVTVRALENSLRALAERAGVREGATFESLRRTAAAGLCPWEGNPRPTDRDRAEPPAPETGAANPSEAVAAATANGSRAGMPTEGAAGPAEPSTADPRAGLTPSQVLAAEGPAPGGPAPASGWAARDPVAGASAGSRQEPCVGPGARQRFAEGDGLHSRPQTPGQGVGGPDRGTDRGPAGPGQRPRCGGRPL